MPEYINPNPHAVHLQGPDGHNIRVMSKQKIYLDIYFDRYVSRGFLKRSDSLNTNTTIRNIQARINLNPQKPQSQSRPKIQPTQSPSTKIQRTQPKNKPEIRQRRIVGKPLQINSDNILISDLTNDYYPISNNIGVGILSYNRKNSLKRLIDSIIKHTDLRSTTIFISDDNSDDQDTIDYLNYLQPMNKFVIINNKENLGVAGNSNRLLRCLSRFEYALLLNDDVEILEKGWEYFYQKATKETGIQHFQYRQQGIYGAQLGILQNIGNLDVRKVNEKPHGAILSFTSNMVQTCGYFDYNYGKYGMEHVDWSMKPAEFALQPPGFFDVEGSSTYFKIHNENTSIDKKDILLKQAREIFNNRKTCQYIHPSQNTEVDSISYVVPVRNLNRQDSINTVINNIRGQRFPNIQIIMVEQDETTNISLTGIMPIEYYLSQNVNDDKFNKSQGFNYGVSKSLYKSIVLHDADMLVISNYTMTIYQLLMEYEACHIGSTVTYTTEQSKDYINKIKVVDSSIKFDRTIGYYEGGSLACRSKTYWDIGGFNEDYKGYGNEDCDFFFRLVNGCNSFTDRSFNLLHLWHIRADGWESHHTANKVLEQNLQKLSTQRRISLQHEQLKRNGYERFLDQ